MATNSLNRAAHSGDAYPTGYSADKPAAQDGDTPPEIPEMYATQRLDRRMGAAKGRTQRRGVGDTVLLQARVRPDQRTKAHAAAAALGISLAAYIDRLLAHEELDEHDRPVWWPTSDPTDQEELPLKTA